MCIVGKRLPFIEQMFDMLGNLLCDALLRSRHRAGFGGNGGQSRTDGKIAAGGARRDDNGIRMLAGRIFATARNTSAHARDFTMNKDFARLSLFITKRLSPYEP